MRFIEIVFMQGNEGYDVQRLISEHGVDAAIEYLAEWDFGAETDQRAEVYGLYGHVPGGAHSREATGTLGGSEYVLMWDPYCDGVVGLYRVTEGVTP